MYRIASGLLLSAALILSGCPDPAKDKAKATVTEAGGDATPIEVGEEGIKLTNANTQLEFVGAKVTRSHTGTFEKFSGVVTVDDAPTSAVINFEIDLASVKTDTERLDGHLKSDDFFDVENHPKATFVTRDVSPAPQDVKESHTVTGDLPMRGTTKSISFPANVEVTEDRFSLDAEFSVDRHEWGVSYKGQADDLIRPNVVIKVKIDAARPS